MNLNDTKLLDNMNFILIDMSYFIFYRYYALIAWWKFAKSDEPLDLSDPSHNIYFLNKFEETFINKLKEIPKKLKIPITDFVCFAAKDCNRSNIWRMDLYNKYKSTRDLNENESIGEFFVKGYDILKSMNIPILYHDKLEADDGIAITTQYILSNYTNSTIYIIANDMDYLQLSCNNIKIINLKYKYLTENRKWSGDPKQDLFCKIVMGDKSDNIPSIFKRCGHIIATKCYNNKTYFNDKLKKENAHQKFENNKKLIDFNEIPKQLKEEFIQNLLIQQK